MEYNIKKGRHFCWHWFKFFFKKECILTHDVKFTSSCLYKFGDVDDFDINKLFGRSFGMHHKNSVRFGWRPEKDKILISSYVYINGIREFNDVCICDIDKTYTFTIDCKDKLVLLEISTDTYKTKYGIKLEKSCNFGYKLYPYFGGNKTAPHDICIQIT